MIHLAPRLLLISLFLPVSLAAQDILQVQRTSQTSSGVGIDADVGAPAISPNSDRIVFASQASNLVPSDSNNRFDIFIQNFTTGVILRLSNPLGPEESDGASTAPAVSAASPNGLQAVAFESNATNIGRSRLTFPDNNNFKDIYLAIPKRSFFVERISVGPGGVAADGDSEQASVALLSAERQVLVAYASKATNLHPNDTLGKEDIFIATISSPGKDNFSLASDISTFRIVAADGSEPNDDSTNPQISVTGQFVVFESRATNLIPGITPTGKQIYLFNRATGSLTLVSRDSSGQPGNDGSRNPTISFNGKFIVYATRATNIIADGFVPAGDNLQFILFNTQTGESKRVNSDSSGAPGNGDNGALAQGIVSADGRFVLFSDTASNLVSNDTNGVSDIFVKDFATNKTTRVSTSIAGEEGNDRSFTPTFARTSFNSDTGRCTWASQATNIVPNDTEGRTDIFLTTVSLPKVPLSKNTVIEVPPDATLDDTNENLTLVLQAFNGVSTARTRPATTEKARIRAARKPFTRYYIKLQQLDVPKKQADNREKFSKRNEITFKNLKPGNYSVKYQAQVVRKKDGDNKVVSRTPFSPSNFFNTLDE